MTVRQSFFGHIKHKKVFRAAGLLLCCVLAACCAQPAWAAEPALGGVFPGDEVLTPGTPMEVSYEASVDGTLEIEVRMRGSDRSEPLPPLAVKAGRGAIAWDGLLGGSPVEPGSWIVQLTLVDAAGARSMPQAAGVMVAASRQAFPPPSAPPKEADAAEQPAAPAGKTPRVPDEDRQLSSFPDPHALCFWGLDVDNIDIYDPADQAKIWEVMMQPMTVLDVGPKEHVYPLVSPDADPKNIDNLAGQVHGMSVGVHVLEHLDNGWSLIETFSTDGYGSPDDDTFRALNNQLIHGYVRTKQLKTVKPYDRLGLLIDKYTQRMYIFKDGALFTTLLVSTGVHQSWSETPAGEYLIDTKVGKFPNNNMQCDLALRINGGCLIHEVPHRERADGTRNYEPYEPYLGQKASHGCVRVQRMRNNDGVNMGWLWNNHKRLTRVLIWDDAGRAPIPVPDTARIMYYNPNGGKSYHSEQNCSAVKARFLPLTELPYEALYESPTDKLLPCYGCVPFFKAPDPEAAIPDDVMGEGTWEE